MRVDLLFRSFGAGLGRHTKRTAAEASVKLPGAAVALAFLRIKFSNSLQVIRIVASNIAPALRPVQFFELLGHVFGRPEHPRIQNGCGIHLKTNTKECLTAEMHDLDRSQY